MNVNIKFSGAVEEILDAAVRLGYASTKTEALRLGVLELNNKYGLIQRYEDDEDARLAEEELGHIKSGKSKIHSEEELWKLLRA